VNSQEAQIALQRISEKVESSKRTWEVDKGTLAYAFQNLPWPCLDDTQVPRWVEVFIEEMGERYV